MVKRSMSEPLSTVSALSYRDCCVLEKENTGNGAGLPQANGALNTPCRDYDKTEPSRVPRTTREVALSLVFNEIANTARSISTASGAAVTLIQQGAPVFSATSGVTAPQVSAYLTSCSAGSWRAGKPQLCQDAEVYSGLDVTGLRKLGVRSFIVMPVLDKGKSVTAIIEAFSAQPHGLSHHDLLLLRSLAQHVANHIEFVEQTLAALAAEVEPSGLNKAEITAERKATSRLTQWTKFGSATVAGKGWNLALGTLMILAAILLGWVLGRGEQDAARRNASTRWVPAFNQLPPAQTGSEREIEQAAQLTSQATPQPRESGIPSPTTSDLKLEEDKQPDSAIRKTTSKSKPSTSRPKKKEASSGELVIFERGKQIFPSESSASNSGDGQSNNPEQTKSSDKGNASVTVSEEVADEHLLERIEPDYPDSARVQHLQGMVVLNIHVDKHGTVRSLSRVSGDPQLSLLAAQAVRRWTFTPLLRDGAPVNFESKITLNFVLP